jgi:transcriptional regulator with PAS, ATPase and Fis domain
LESELFGHMRGSFTDAKGDKHGLFEEAHKGTLFLDEISELPITLQAKLLRAIQEKEIRRIGATKPVSVDVRIIAATNLHLADEVKAKRFREDLYYRLNVIEVKLPPLRDRREDIPLLVDGFLKKCGTARGKEVKGVGSRVGDVDGLHVAWKCSRVGECRRAGSDPQSRRKDHARRSAPWRAGGTRRPTCVGRSCGKDIAAA